ncbi:MAG: hypothetical protein HY718_12880, partial [Planctomycetes bacterium]|nr:hypothetical protein [Planctomycetota bacterium]
MTNPPTALRPRTELARAGTLCLVPFDPLMAPVVARWTRDDRELFWLAPRTVPPLTAAKVVAWASPDGRPLLCIQDDLVEPA